MRAAAQAAFVLVAGGLGERLGFSGIKLALPVESASRKCFLQVKTLLHCVLCMGPHVMLSMHVRLLDMGCSGIMTSILMSIVMGCCEADISVPLK